MTLELTITKQSDPSFNEIINCNKFPVFLGREEKNDVILADPFKVVSRKHSKIIETEGILQLVDLEAANYTFLNEEKLNPSEEYALKPGDKIKIGEYELKVNIVLDKEVQIDSDDDQRTMVFSSPFASDVHDLAEGFKTLAAKYSLDDSPGKADMLKFSVLQSFSAFEKNDVSKILAEYFADHYLDNSFNKVSAKQPELKSEIKIQETPTFESFSKIKKSDESPAPPLPPEYYFSSHFSNTTDVLLEAFATLIQGFLQFRQEFFGVTIYHTLPVGSLKELKEYLFTPDISTEDEKKRLTLLKEETQKLLSHQIGLLEGYRSSITDGSKSLLQSLDPVIIEKELEAKNAKAGGINIAKVLPFSQKAKVLDLIKENYSKYMNDIYHVEKKYFRPAFMKGYQKRISASQKNNEY